MADAGLQLVTDCNSNLQRFFFGRPIRRPNISTTDLWKNRPVKQKPQVVIVVSFSGLLNATRQN